VNADGLIYATREQVPEEDRERFEAYLREEKQACLKDMEAAMERLRHAEVNGLVL
jgi:hypothetical protein